MFDGLGIDLKPAHTGQAEWSHIPKYGIYTEHPFFVNVNGTETSPTVFKRMDNGIWAKSTICNIKKARFESLLRRPATTGGVTGGYGLIMNNNWFSVTGFGNSGNVDKSSFYKVSTAIKANGSVFSVTGNTTNEVDFGMVGAKSQGNISDNYFIYNKGGLLFTSPNGMGVTVLNNKIVTYANEVTYGIAASGFNASTMDKQGYDIKNNYILVRSKNVLPPPTVFGAGIYLNNTKNANVEGNKITLTPYELGATGDNEHPVIYGILTSNSPDNTICSNEVNGITAPDPNDTAKVGYGRGIFLINSTNNKVSCNIVDSVRNALEFRMNCNSSNSIQGNVLLNSDIGLLAAEKQGTSAIVGPQSYMGNLWINQSILYKKSALYQSSNQFDVLLERLTVNNSSIIDYIDPTGGADYKLVFKPVPPNFTTAWFFEPPIPDPNFLCGNNGNQACQDNRIGRRMEGEGIHKKIARSEYSIAGWNPAYQGLVRRSVFSDIRDKYGSGAIPSAYTTFYNNQLNTTVERALNIDNALATIGFGNTAAVARLGAIDSLILVNVTAGTALPLNLMSERDSLVQVVKTGETSDAYACNNLNQNYNGTQSYELLDAEMNSIWLSDFVGRETPLLSHLSRIQTVARWCPEQNGAGVFKARSMYLALLYHPDPLWELCAPFENSQNRDEASTIELKCINTSRVFPNPTDGMFYLESNSIGKRINISDLTGKTVYSNIILDFLTRIDLTGLSNGIFFLKIEGESNPVKILLAN